MSLHRRAFTKTLAALGVTAAAPALTTATPAWAQGKTIEVSMKNNPKALFVPATVNCKVGDTVNWTNPGIITHSVTFDPAQAATKENVVLPALQEINGHIDARNPLQHIHATHFVPQSQD